MRVCIFMKVPFFGTSQSVTMETVALFEKLNKGVLASVPTYGISLNFA